MDFCGEFFFIRYNRLIGSKLQARLSGLVLRYALPACNLMEKIECQFRISKIALNSITTFVLKTKFCFFFIKYSIYCVD